MALLAVKLAMPSVSHAQEQGSLTDTVAIDGSVVKAQMTKTRLTGNSLKTTIRGTALEKSGTAYEMLSKVPGMTMKGEYLEVIGKGVPVYYINGRKVHDAEELKLLHSDEVQNVEVIMNPGSLYDATVSSVVRIRTIRRQGEGFGFDMTAGNSQDLVYGYSEPSSILNMRYRHNSVDVFGMVQYWNVDEIRPNTREQSTFFKKDGQLVNILQHSHNFTYTDFKGVNYNLGFNWQISNDHSVGMRVQNNDAFDTILSSRSETAMDYIVAGNVQSSFSENEDTRVYSYPYNWSGNAYYNGQIGKLNIDLNVDFVTQKQIQKSAISETMDESVPAMMEQRTHSSADLWAEKLVFSYPVWKGQLQAGTEATLVNRNSFFEMTGYPLPSTDAEIKESNLAGFVQYAFSLPKYGNFSAGLRYEHVGFDYADVLNPAQSMSRYTDEFFPSLSWAHQIGKIQTSLSYSVKTVRPDYGMLSESISYQSAYSFGQGNSKLKNAVMQQASAAARWKWVNLFATYERRDNAHTAWSYVYNDEGVILVKNINLDKPVRSLSALISFNPTFGVYSPNWTFGGQRFWVRQTLMDPSQPTGYREIGAEKPVFQCNMNNAFRFKRSFQLEANLNILTKGDVMNYSLTQPSYDLGFVLQKSWLENDALTLRISVEDVLKKRLTGIRLDCGYYVMDQHIAMNCHRLNVSLRYVFNATHSKYRGTGAGIDAQDRM